MRKIEHSEIKTEWNEGLVVAVEYKYPNGRIVRAVVQKVEKDGTVETIYGNITPTAIYSFKTLTEARTFLDEV